jgi:hypothetical protein
MIHMTYDIQSWAWRTVLANRVKYLLGVRAADNEKKHQQQFSVLSDLEMARILKKNIIYKELWRYMILFYVVVPRNMGDVAEMIAPAWEATEDT